MKDCVCDVDVPALQSLVIGEANNFPDKEMGSFSFYFCDELSLRGLPSLSSIIIGSFAFYRVRTILLEGKLFGCVFSKICLHF